MEKAAFSKKIKMRHTPQLWAAELESRVRIAGKEMAVATVEVLLDKALY